MSNETTNYLIKDIPKEQWKKFKGHALISGYNSVGDLLKKVISDTVVEGNNE